MKEKITMLCFFAYFFRHAHRLDDKSARQSSQFPALLLSTLGEIQFRTEVLPHFVNCFDRVAGDGFSRIEKACVHINHHWHLPFVPEKQQ